jgi:hypothetical protein
LGDEVRNAAPRIKVMTPEQVVQANLDAYNARDLDTFMFWFADNAEMAEFGSDLSVSGGAIRERYAAVFAASPALHSTILKRIVIGNKVIDHEQIIGRMGASEALELVLIYVVQGNKIISVTTIRA